MTTKQNNPKLKKAIYDEGCYFLFALGVYSDLTGVDPNPDEVNTVYDMAVDIGAIRSDCYMNPGAFEKIFGICTNLFGVSASAIFLWKENKDGSRFDVGSVQVGNKHYNADDFGFEPTHYAALYIATLNGKTYGHFVKVDRETGEVLDDSWPNSNAVRNGYVKSYRAIHAKLV